MSDIFGIAKSGLQAYKEGLATTGQNIANVGNEAYARREAPTSEVTSGKDVLQVSNTAGFGVRVDGITRAFDQFIDTQLQSAASSFSFSTSQATVLNQLETVVRPAEGSVSQKIQELFSALNSVAQDPSDLASRHVAADASMALVNSITTVANGISDLRTFVSQDIESNVAQANDILDQLANLQNQLLGISSNKRGPNDLLDKRDALLKDLSELMDINVEYKPNGLLEVNAGTFGQGQSLISGIYVSKLEVQKVDGTSKLFMRSSNGDGLSKIQVQAGKIAGNLASDITLVQTKSALDQLSQKLVREFNEAQTFGVDLNGELGREFFSLDGTKIEKQGTMLSSSQISLSGNKDQYLGQKLEVSYSAADETWTLKNDLGNELGKFEDFFEYEGLTINISGEGALGDNFVINFTEGLSENLTFQLENGRQIAASAFYLVERDPLNTSSAKVSISRFDEVDPGAAPTLNSMFEAQRNSANPIDFLNNGALGVINDVDQLNNLTSIKTQSKLQFSEPLTSLDSSTQLIIKLDNVDRIFELGDLHSSIDNYQVLADYLNSGVIRSDDVNAFSFSDLGLFAGGNLSTLSVTSASLPNYSSYPSMESGTFGSATGILIPAQPGNADIQIFTREGVQLAGRPLSQSEITSYVSFENGFSRNAEYRSDYLSNDLSDTYIGASVVRKTTDGNHLASISSLGLASSVDSNLSVAAMADFPTSRPMMSAPLTITNDVGGSYTFQPETGMMAGNIAESLENEISKLGLAASASNRLEIFNIANGTLSFDLLGDNSSAVSISKTISDGDTGGLINEINDAADVTGIKAYTSGEGAIILEKTDGNDIIIKNLVTANASTISTRQIDEFGEVIATAAQGIPVTVSTGNYIVSGGQIKITSPSELQVTCGVNTLNSQKSEFISSFIDKQFDLENKKIDFKFDALAGVDANAHDQTGLIGVAASSSYSFVLSSDNDNQSNAAIVKPNSTGELTSGAVAAALVSELRKASPQSNFVGNEFDFQDGFPADQSIIEFQLGEHKYSAVLNNKLTYTVEGSDVIIAGEKFSQADALKQIVNASSFTISGPEEDRLTVGFEAHGAGFRLFAAAKDGVVSGHGVRLSDNNSAAQKSIFHLDHNTAGDTKTRIISGEFDTTQGAQVNFAQVIAGNTTIDLSFDPDTDPKLTQSAVIAGISISLEDTGNDNGRIVVTVDQSTADLDVGLKATNNSANFGVLTSSSQLMLESGGFSVVNHDNERVTTTATVESLANEVFSINGLSGEDLIVIAAGTGKISLLGDVETKIDELDPRELQAKVSANDSKRMDIFDMVSGDLLGSRKINETNDFFFRDFKWELTGNLANNDIFNVRTTTERLDDASNLVQMMKLSELSVATGKGGYSQQYNDLVMDVGFNVRSSEQGLENAKLIYDVAADRKSSFSGVDLDTEATRLLEQQQAYQALAKVLSTAKEMVDTLLRSM